MLPCPTSEPQVLLRGQSGRAALMDRSHTTSKWLCQQQQQPLELLCRAKVPPQTCRQQGRALPVPCGAELYKAHRSCLGPADRKGFSKEKQDRKDPVIP